MHAFPPCRGRRFAVSRVLGVALLSTSGCGGSGSDSPSGIAGTLDRISVVIYPPSTLPIGGSTHATAHGVDGAGNEIPLPTPLSWRSSSTSVATVTADTGQSAIVVAVGTGQAYVVVTAAGITGGEPFTVTSVRVGSVTVEPATVTVRVGQFANLTLVIKDANGNTLDLGPPTWTSSDPSKVFVGQYGLVQGMSLGVATVTATASGQTASALVTVAP